MSKTKIITRTKYIDELGNKDCILISRSSVISRLDQISNRKNLNTSTEKKWSDKDLDYYTQYAQITLLDDILRKKG